MSQQIVVIGGGTTFDKYEDYISYLKNKEIDLERLKARKDWKDSLGEELGKNFEVLVPRMPNVTNARYQEWKIWFERIIPFLHKNVILIGHSLGGIFLAKYLSENSFPETIRSTILVSAPFDDSDREKGQESLTEFALPASLARFAKQGGVIYLIQSKDDPAIPSEQLEKYKKALPNAKTMVFNDRGHFKQETFPELVSLIKTLKV